MEKGNKVPQTVRSPSWLLTGVILGDVKNTDAKNVPPKTLKGLWKGSLGIGIFFLTFHIDCNVQPCLRTPVLGEGT